MSKTQNNKLPMIMLPISMIVAGLVSGLPSTLIAILNPFLMSNLGISYQVTNVLSVIGSFVGSISYVVVIVLFSLVCKGLQKKLCFIMSIYVGTIAQVVLNIVVTFTYGLLTILPIGDYTVQSLIISGGNGIGGIIYCVLEVIVAIFFFKYISSFTEKEFEADTQAYKVNLLIPAIVIAGYGILTFVLSLATSFIVTLLNGLDTYIYLAISQAIYAVIHVLKWGILIGVAFIIKDKYQRFTLVGSVILGSSIWGFVSVISNVATLFLPALSTAAGVLTSVVTTALGIGAGILIYYLANKKQYVKIKA
ncbi:MAG: hypothetical protein IKT55_05925 [Clostridia bacterium]|nr:hypothetical protein [Clostridia bacterium]